jgi:hypothetical protein
MWWYQLSMPVPPVALSAEPARATSSITRVLLRLGGGLCVGALAFLLQLALAHPAGAATQPVSGLLGTADTLVGSTTVPAVASSVGQTVATVGQAVSTVGQVAGSVAQAAASVVGSTTAPVLNAAPVRSVLQPVAQTVSTLIGPSAGPLPGLPSPVASLPAPVGGSVGTLSPAARAGLSTTARPVVGTPTAVFATGATAPLPTLLGPALVPLIPMVVHRASALTMPQPTSFSVVSGAKSAPAPAPQRRLPPLFPSPAGATSDASSPTHGSSPLDAFPPMGLLLPALIALGVLIGRQRSPLFLFDMRFAPPG